VGKNLSGIRQRWSDKGTSPPETACLKTTDNWKKVELVGWVDHQMKYTHYKGGLVKLNGKLYFVQDKTIKALQEFMNWNFPTKIKVVD
jgi:hypothetical protein